MVVVITKRKCACGRRYLKERERKCALCKTERRKTTSRSNHVRKTYGLNDTQYSRLKDQAEGNCMMCGEARSYNLAVDHDHSVERIHGTAYSVRGLVCKRCNTLLRKSGDSASLLRAGASYLDSWPSSQALANVQGFTEDRRS